jgi:hypothetical protein
MKDISIQEEEDLNYFSKLPMGWVSPAQFDTSGNRG